MIMGLLSALPHTVTLLARENSDLSALALVLGVVGGCMLSAWREQLAAQRAAVARRRRRPR